MALSIVSESAYVCEQAPGTCFTDRVETVTENL